MGAGKRSDSDRDRRLGGEKKEIYPDRFRASALDGDVACPAFSISHAADGEPIRIVRFFRGMDRENSIADVVRAESTPSPLGTISSSVGLDGTIGIVVMKGAEPKVIFWQHLLYTSIKFLAGAVSPSKGKRSAPPGDTAPAFFIESISQNPKRNRSRVKWKCNQPLSKGMVSLYIQLAGTNSPSLWTSRKTSL